MTSPPSLRTPEAATPAPNYRSRAADAIVGALGSRWAFAAVVAVAIAQSLVIAYTAGYPAIYDEAYHFGLIKLFASEGTPFISDPQNHAGFGDLTHFGSFLFHYLMGGPYLLAKAVGLGEVGRLMVLRTISVLLAASSLIWFRKTLRLCGISPASTNVSLGLFISLPFLSSLWATVNYDNLMLPLGAAFLWCGARAFMSPRLNVRLLIAMVALGSLASLATFAFLPLFAAGLAAVIIRQLIRLRGTVWSKRFELLTVQDLRSPTLWASVISAAVGLYFVVALYVVTFARFGSPVPDCARLNPVAYCAQYAPWYRNNILYGPIAHPPGLAALPTYFVNGWLLQQFQTLAVVGNANHRIIVGGSEVVLALLALIALLILIVTLKFLWKSAAVKFVIICGIALFVVLFERNFSEYNATGQPVAVQSRYLMLFMPFVIAFAVDGMARILNRLHGDAAVWKFAILILMLLLLSQVGGVMNFFVSAQPTWFLTNGWLSGATPFLTQLAHQVNLAH